MRLCPLLESTDPTRLRVDTVILIWDERLWIHLADLPPITGT
jgi:hypothetical protein